MFETSVELYYKQMQNQIEYKAGLYAFSQQIRKTLLYLERGGVMERNGLSTKPKAD